MVVATTRVGGRRISLVAAAASPSTMTSSPTHRRQSPPFLLTRKKSFWRKILNFPTIETALEFGLQRLLGVPVTRHLKLNLFKEPINIPITKAVDGLLWISPHIMFVLIEYGLLNRSSIKFQFTYKKQLTYQGETASCCNSLPVSCWQHCIKEVKLEIIDINLPKENQPILYTVNGENILEKIDAILGAPFSRGKSTNTMDER
ncbi:hypothetical protein Ddye_020021 [Dipteronia dyeriana]|uniref:Uncharacterized protein n=1 Tax=Dipteronia dyeriana TaxID=168575 RepID=A0AAD9TZS4_9ROSI|nr:hypothetical protein Ddye_020021 [Dipteronia dyeriana]